jgi:hypothetical protein
MAAPLLSCSSFAAAGSEVNNGLVVAPYRKYGATTAAATEAGVHADSTPVVFQPS